MARPSLTADETDAFGRYRRSHTWKAGQRKAIKRTASRRDRRSARSELRRGREI